MFGRYPPASRGYGTAAWNRAFIAERIAAHPGRPIVWLDADARVRSMPILFGGLIHRADFAAHWREQSELLSGTLYFAPTPAAAALLSAWKAEQDQRPNEWDQVNLQRTLTRLAATNQPIRVVGLAELHADLRFNAASGSAGDRTYAGITPTAEVVAVAWSQHDIAALRKIHAGSRNFKVYGAGRCTNTEDGCSLIINPPPKPPPIPRPPEVFAKIASAAGATDPAGEYQSAVFMSGALTGMPPMGLTAGQPCLIENEAEQGLANAAGNNVNPHWLRVGQCFHGWLNGSKTVRGQSCPSS